MFHHKPLKERLIERGWSAEEAERTNRIITDPDMQRKHQPVRAEMNMIVYWMVLTVLTVCNFLISLVLIPLLVVLPPSAVLAVVFILGMVFGLLFNLLIFDIEHIEEKHHYAAAVFIPFIAILNMYIITSVANGFSVRLQSQQHESPFLIALIYVVAFLTPYLVTIVKGLIRKKREAALLLQGQYQQAAMQQPIQPGTPQQMWRR